MAIAHVISTLLMHMCDSTLCAGILPDEMIIATVCLLQKGGSLNDLDNYKPIFVLRLFLKILEQVVHSKFTWYLETKNITHQHNGFQKEIHRNAFITYKK